MPLFRNFSVLGYMPVSLPLPCDSALSGLSISGWTRLKRPLNSCGRPKNIHSLPTVSFSATHFVPLKNTASMMPLPSESITLSFFAPASWLCTLALSCT